MFLSNRLQVPYLAHKAGRLAAQRARDPGRTHPARHTGSTPGSSTLHHARASDYSDPLAAAMQSGARCYLVLRWCAVYSQLGSTAEAALSSRKHSAWSAGMWVLNSCAGYRAGAGPELASFRQAAGGFKGRQVDPASQLRRCHSAGRAPAAAGWRSRACLRGRAAGSRWPTACRTRPPGLSAGQAGCAARRAVSRQGRLDVLVPSWPDPAMAVAASGRGTGSSSEQPAHPGCCRCGGP
jgi:hypothetical protein